MYRLQVKSHFSSAHQVIGYEGPCAKTHGHNWKVLLEVEAESLDEVGISCDFRKIREILEGVTSRLDHEMINDVPPFDVINPTAEHLAKYIYDSVKDLLPEMLKIDNVQVSESDKYSVVYYES